MCVFMLKKEAPQLSPTFPCVLLKRLLVAGGPLSATDIGFRAQPHGVVPVTWVERWGGFWKTSFRSHPAAREPSSGLQTLSSGKDTDPPTPLGCYPLVSLSRPGQTA